MAARLESDFLLLGGSFCSYTVGVYGEQIFYGDEGSIHIEVLLPAFVLGMVMKHKEIDTPLEHKVSTGVSFLFMFLVGMSMPLFVGVDFRRRIAVLIPLPDRKK